MNYLSQNNVNIARRCRKNLNGAFALSKTIETSKRHSVNTQRSCTRVQYFHNPYRCRNRFYVIS